MPQNYVYYVDESIKEGEAFPGHAESRGYSEPGWYYYCPDTDSYDMVGPFETENGARLKFDEYCEHLKLEPVTPQLPPWPAEPPKLDEDHHYRGLPKFVDTLYGFAFGGNGYGKYSSTDCLKLDFDKEQGVWRDKDGLLIVPSFEVGTPTINIQPGPHNMEWSCYISPNADDVTRFKAGFDNAAMIIGHNLCSDNKKPDFLYLNGIGIVDYALKTLSNNPIQFCLNKETHMYEHELFKDVKIENEYGNAFMKFVMKIGEKESNFSGEVFYSTNLIQVKLYTKGISNGIDSATHRFPEHTLSHKVLDDGQISDDYYLGRDDASNLLPNKMKSAEYCQGYFERMYWDYKQFFSTEGYNDAKIDRQTYKNPYAGLAGKAYGVGFSGFIYENTTTGL